MEKESLCADSISGCSYVTTLISEPGLSTPSSGKSDFELIYYPSSSSSASSQHAQSFTQLPLSYRTSTSSDSDTDSSLGTSISSAHTSLKSFVTLYPFEHGRRYHAFRAGEYLLPNDEGEQARLQLSHHVWGLMMGGELCSERVKEGLLGDDGEGRSGLRVLDVGTGTGCWAMDWADEWVERGCTVVGNDLSPIQPRWVPPNCSFVVDDFQSPWSYHPAEAFDFIHARNLAGSVSSWPTFFSHVFRHLRRDGWFELQECEVQVSSDVDPDLKRAPRVRAWIDQLEEGSRRFGKSFAVGDGLEKDLRRVGFVDVGKETFEIPIGAWPDDEYMKEIGLFQRECVLDGIEAYTLALFTRVLGWSSRDAKFFIKGVKNELRDQTMRWYSKFHILYGRRTS